MRKLGRAAENGDFPCYVISFRNKNLRKKLLGFLCAVTRTRLLSLGNACGIECAAHDMITNAGQVLNSSASDEYGRVLLKVMAFAGDVNGTFLLVGKSYPCNLSDCRVRLLGRGGRYGKAYAAFLRAVVQNGRLALENFLLPAVLYKLIDCGHLTLLLVLLDLKFKSVEYISCLAPTLCAEGINIASR